jgi:hypothetical protein
MRRQKWEIARQVRSIDASEMRQKLVKKRFKNLSLKVKKHAMVEVKIKKVIKKQRKSKKNDSKLSSKLGIKKMVRLQPPWLMDMSGSVKLKIPDEESHGSSLAPNTQNNGLTPIRESEDDRMIKLAIKASLAKAGNNKLDRISTEEQEQERLAM